MSNLAPFRSNAQPGLPTPPAGDTIAQYATYLEAQQAVDYLSDQHFPVRAVTIVGVDLKMVERVTGRLTYGRAAMLGFGSGAYFGLMVGLLIAIFGSAKGFSVPAAIIVGGAFGLLFGVISYAFTGGRRDFTSTSQIVASEYRVLCLTEQAGKAMQLLNQMARDGGPTSSGGPTGLGTAPVTPAPGTTPPPFAGSPAGPAADASTADQPTVPVTGPTYSEMIDRKKAEDKEKAEADRLAAERTAEADRTAEAEQTRAGETTVIHQDPA
jgi:hypothetical protein